jgi:hypothetical protein
MKLFTKMKVKRNWLPRALPLTILMLILLLPTAVDAEDFYIMGRVYSALTLGVGEEVPENPLSSIPPTEIIGKNLVAKVTRNLVKVRVVKESDNSKLGEFLVTNKGGYLINFNKPLPPGMTTFPVRFIVEELVTGSVLLKSDKQELTPGPAANKRFLLIPEDATEIDNDREFAPAVTPPDLYTAIFTRVGKIEVSTEVGGATVFLIDPDSGEATVPSSIATSLYIPEYKNAPFGGNLFIFGAFSKDFYYPTGPHNYYYRIKIKNLTTLTETYMNHPLEKTRYRVDFTTGRVYTAREKLGPDTIEGVSNCYRLTPIAVSNDVFYSFPDLVALWPTGINGGLNGKYQLTLEVVDLPTGGGPYPYPPPAIPGFKPLPNYTSLTLHLDNVAPQAKILRLDPSDSFATPRVYRTSAGTLISEDLIDGTPPGTPLGSFPSDYGGTANPICMILNLQEPIPAFTKYLTFKLTAYHSNGYLRYWFFKYKRNDEDDYNTLLGKTYDCPTPPPPGCTMKDYPGAMINSTQTALTGFQDKFLYIKNARLGPAGGCAYRFVIGASTRTTDGYHYLRYDWSEDLHYVQR